MSISELVCLAGRVYRYMPNKKLVKEWWPKPLIKQHPKKYWGTKWTNGDGILHKYTCRSFSTIGFITKEQQVEGLPKQLCFAHGESPEQAYDRWCELFNSWNKKEEWVK